MARKNSKKTTADAPGSGRLARLAGWTAFTGAVVFVLCSLISFDPADWPSHAVSPHNSPPQNWCGRVGAFLAYHLYHAFGHGLWVAVALLAAAAFVTATGRRITHAPVRIVGLAFMTLAASGLQALWLPTTSPFPEGGGGLLAIAGVHVLVDRFNPGGTALILLVMFGIGAAVAVDQLVVRAPVLAFRAIQGLRHVPARQLGSTILGALAGLASALRVRREPIAAGASVSASGSSVPVRLQSKRGAKKSKEIEHRIDPDAGGLGATESFDPEEAELDADEEYEEYEDEDYDEEESDQDEDEEYDEDDAAANAPAVKSRGGDIDMNALREKIRRLPVNFASASKNKAPQEADIPRSENYEGYRFPTLELLADPEATYSEQMEKFVREQAEVLEHALKTYRIDGEVVGIDSGPVITLYEVQLAPGTKVAAINSIHSDIARALRAPNIRVVPNMAGKTTVGIEVPNLRKEKVRIKELMTATDAARKMKLPMFLGKDASGTPLIGDLTAMPHMLIAGTTGSGKSVCINTIIVSFLYTKRPDELKLILVDPKMVEMSQFRDIPHLMCPVVTEMGKAAAILEWAVTKMEERYELLAEAGVRDIAAYNELEWEELRERFGPMNEAEEAKLPKKLPYMVFIIDELADLIMTNKEVESFIVRIAQKARAVGIHLILATQRPQANVVTGLIKANMPCRVAFKVASGMDSRIVLDQKGAELLLGQGDMLYLSPRTSELMRAQGTLVEDAEIRKVVRFLKEVASPTYERQLLTLRSSAEPEGELNPAERDPLFNQAVDIIIETQRGSVSLLQRRLSIGYTRASRLIDQMGLAGIIGEHKGSVAREVLISPEEWEQMRAMMEQEEADGTLFANGADQPAAESSADDDEDAADDAEYEGDDAADDEDDYEEDAGDDDLFEEEEDADEAEPERAPF